MFACDYYVYGIKRGGSLVYIGKGTDDRVLQSLRKHHGDEYVIFQEGLSEKHAFEEEKRYIRVALAMGAQLENKVIYQNNVLPVEDFCKRGHEYTEENTKWLSDGRRLCMACKEMANEKFRRPAWINKLSGISE